MDDLELYQFKRSHYNEKARWALDYKQLPHRRHSLLPGPHKLTVTRLSGQAQVPVLRHGDVIVAGSDRIIDYLEEHEPEPALQPRSEDARTEARQLVAWFDDEVGPAVRCAAFADLMDDPSYFASTFTDDRSLATRVIYRAALPVTQALMKRDLGITAEAIPAARATVLAALDRVAKQSRATGYLIGDSFGIADLTAAALLMPAVQPPEGPIYPEPRAAVVDRWTARWSEHPGSAWVRGIYQRHRGSSAEIAG
jgi:glutathione S-transferase